MEVYKTLEGSPEDKILAMINDEELEEVMCIGPNKSWKVYHRRKGMMDTDFILNDKELEKVVNWIISRGKGKSVEKKTMMDMMLPEGARVNIVFPPVAINGPYITIRLFPKNPLNIVDLVKNGTLSVKAAGYLWTVVDGFDAKPANVIITGGGGSGKTTLLNALTFFIPPDKRVITIEDTAELNLPHEHWVRMEVPIGYEIDMDTLLKNALRMRPDRLIIGEVRGEEAKTLFTAMNVGHEGCMGTVHANSSVESISRITSPPMSVPMKMVEALDLILLMIKINTPHGTRRVLAEVTEISGVEEKKVRVNPLLKLDPKALALKPTGIPSSLRDRISRAAGISPTKFMEEVERRAKIIDRLCKEELSSKEVFIRLHEEKEAFYPS